MKYTIIMAFTLLNCLSVLCQTGPGGVGSTDGTSTLDIWLRDIDHFSDAGSTPSTNGTSLQQWNDASGNSNHASQTVSSRQPLFNTNSKNSYPTLEFSGDDELRVSYDISPSVRPDITVIAVADHNTAASSPLSKLFGHDNAGFDRSIGFDNRCGSNTFHYFGGGVNCFVSPSANSDFIVTAEYTSSTFSGRFNGSLLINSVANSNGDGESFLTIGNITDRNLGQTYSEFWDGSITEFMVFGATINSSQHIIISNYLAAKYNISLASNDLYTQDNPGNGDYDHDVAGIGRVDASNIHDDSQGTGIVRMLNPSGLGNDEFLIWGHDNGTQQATETSDVPSGVQARFDRVWRVSEVNTSGSAVDVGSIDIRFDLTGLGSVTVSDLRLIIDTDDDGLFDDETPISGATNVSGSVYQFASVTAITNNSRFTIGTSNFPQTPLPIELVKFTAKGVDDRMVQLDWQTASEINNDYFTLERSKNGNEWEEVVTIDGAGNSTTLLSYSWIDKTPYPGTSYYRLKQTDFSGQFDYSPARRVSTNEWVPAQVQVYPNPAENEINIVGSASELDQCRIYNAVGQDVSDLTVVVRKNDGQATVDLSTLKQGMYCIKTRTTIHKVYKQ